MAMNLRLPEELNEQLRAVAHQEGRSMQQIAVTAISEYLAAKRGREANQVFMRIAEEDAGLLDRLGNS